ncbi:MAG: hypothetical protein F9K40_21170 [Kofleriaceae bacterium]|nr:MAG: hypothetical protein F9K40_21170 [Kofleriaceae bacterium]
MRSRLLAKLAFALVIGAFAATAAAQPRGPKKPKKVKVDVAALKVAFLGGDAEKSKAAAVELGKTDDAAAHAVLLDGLGTGLHPDVAAAALTSLAA